MTPAEIARTIRAVPVRRNLTDANTPFVAVHYDLVPAKMMTPTWLVEAIRCAVNLPIAVDA